MPGFTDDDPIRRDWEWCITKSGPYAPGELFGDWELDEDWGRGERTERPHPTQLDPTA